jgi:murein DD-endopeptidase MepM/ murein hydrolase activator NlpD
MINLKLTFGKKELAVKFGNKRGRPKKTLVSTTQKFLAYLKKVFQDRRFKGNKISRVLRRIFEIKKIKEVIGINLILVVFFSGAISRPISAFDLQAEPDSIVYAPDEVKVITEKAFSQPLDSFRISQGYHYYHRAIDLDEDFGQPVHSIANGIIKEVIFSQSGYGNYLVVNHGSGIKSLYAHLGEIKTKKGQEVSQGAILGTIGTSGWSTGPHLHLEIWENNQPINPLAVLE